MSLGCPSPLTWLLLFFKEYRSKMICICVMSFGIYRLFVTSDAVYGDKHSFALSAAGRMQHILALHYDLWSD